MYGSTLVRKCWCETSPTTCPRHVIADLIESTPVGQPVFGAMSPKEANADLRRRLAAIGIPNAHQFTLYAMRRGHAMDLVESGARLWEILQAGEWRSPAFLAYLKLHRVECEATREAQAIAPQFMRDVFDDSDADGDDVDAV